MMLSLRCFTAPSVNKTELCILITNALSHFAAFFQMLASSAQLHTSPTWIYTNGTLSSHI